MTEYKKNIGLIKTKEIKNVFQKVRKKKKIIN